MCPHLPRTPPPPRNTLFLVSRETRDKERRVVRAHRRRVEVHGALDTRVEAETRDAHVPLEALGAAVDEHRLQHAGRRQRRAFRVARPLYQRVLRAARESSGENGTK